MDFGSLNLRHLRLFVQVCDIGSLNRVAERLNVSQPSISIALSRLEENFGSVLLSRHATGSLPTPAGNVLLARLRRMESQLAGALGQALGAAVKREPSLVSRLLDRVTLRQIHALVALSETASFVEAARRNGSAPATLHRLLHDLRENIGRAIFGRGPSGMTLNAAGQRLALQCQVALTEIEQARDELRELEGRLEGRVKIGSLPLARTLLLARAINPLLAEHRGAKIEVTDGSYEMLSRQLRSGACDILIGALRSGTNVEGLRTEPLFEDPYAIVCRPSHPLLHKGRPVEIEDLAGMEWVAQRPDTPIRAAFDALFEGSPLTPTASIETSSLVLTRAIIIESDRLAFLSLRQIAVEDRGNILCCLPLSPRVQRAIGTRTIGVTIRENWLPSLLQRTFLERLRTAATSID